MKKTLALSTAVLAAAATFSLAKNQPDAAAPADANQAQRQPQQQQQENQNQEQEFIKHASSDNQFEIQAGEFVAQSAQDQQVKQLGQRLAQDHQKAQQQLQKIAQQMRVEGSDQLTPVDQAKLEELKKKQGQDLERCFAFMQVGGHETDLLSYRWQSEHAADPQLKQYAQQQISVLEEHLHMARQAAEQFVPEARTAGERIRGAARDAAGTLDRGARDVTGSRHQGTSGTSGTTGGNDASGGASPGVNR